MGVELVLEAPPTELDDEVELGPDELFAILAALGKRGLLPGGPPGPPIGGIIPGGIPGGPPM